MSVFVIGEMASAHDGDVDKAKRLVDVAVAAGCDAVKVQFWSDADQLADRRKVPLYYRDIYKKYQIPVEWLAILKRHCGDRIEFMATCFLPQDANVISPFVKRFKVSAFEAQANDLLRAVFVEAKHRQVIISVNQMMPMSDLIKSNQMIMTATTHQRMFRKFFKWGSDAKHSDWQWQHRDTSRAQSIADATFSKTEVLMYCVSEYPATLASVDLSQIRKYSAWPVGFSDHTGDLAMGAFAVCAGATYIEAHMKLVNTDALNPDGGPFAHLPRAFKQYVKNIRKAESVGYGETLPASMHKYRVMTP